MSPLLFRIAVLAVPFASALVFSPRLTMEQYELPKHAAIVILAAVIVSARPGIAGPRSWLSRPPLAGFLGALFISALFSAAPLVSLLGHYENLEGLVTWASYGLIFLAGASVSSRMAGRFSTAVIAAAALSSAYALLQQAGFDPFPGENFTNVRSFAGNPDFLAQQMAMAIPLAAGAALASSRLSPMILAAIFLFVLLQTSSRAGAAAGLAGLALVLWFQRQALGRNAARLVLAAGVFAGALALSQTIGLPGRTLVGRLAGLLSPAGFAQSRGMLWLGTARVARENPLIGCGTDTLGGFFLKHAPRGWASLEGLGTTARKAHDEPLHLLATTGVIGLGCYLWLLLWALGKWRRKDGPLRAPAVAAVAACLVHNLFSFGTAATSPVFWFLLGWICPPALPEREPGGASRAAVLPVALLLGFLGVLRLAADGYGFRGNEADRRNDIETSASMFSKASAIAPFEAAYLARLGWGLERQGRLEEARKAYEGAFKRIPSNGLFLGNVARVTFAQASKSGSETDRREAFASLLRAIDLAPSQPTLYGAAIVAARKLGLEEEQETLARQLYERDPSWAAKMLSAR